MLLKFFGIIDMFAGAMFWIYGILNYVNFNLISSSFVFAVGVILLIKGLIFIAGMDFFSFLDVGLGGIIIWASYSDFPIIIICIVSLYLVQKGFFSWIGDSN